MMKEDWVYRRGDIYLANLGKPEGSQQGGVRPVVILQNDIGNYYSPNTYAGSAHIQNRKKETSADTLLHPKSKRAGSTFHGISGTVGNF